MIKKKCLKITLITTFSCNFVAKMKANPSFAIPIYQF